MRRPLPLVTDRTGEEKQSKEYISGIKPRIFFFPRNANGMNEGRRCRASARKPHALRLLSWLVLIRRPMPNSKRLDLVLCISTERGIKAIVGAVKLLLLLSLLDIYLCVIPFCKRLTSCLSCVPCIF